MEKFTVEEIRKYILSQDSLGDVLYNLTEEKIKTVNQKLEDEDSVGCLNAYSDH